MNNNEEKNKNIDKKFVQKMNDENKDKKEKKSYKLRIIIN
jgi:hypothetical protein